MAASTENVIHKGIESVLVIRTWRETNPTETLVHEVVLAKIKELQSMEATLRSSTNLAARVDYDGPDATPEEAFNNECEIVLKLIDEEKAVLANLLPSSHSNVHDLINKAYSAFKKNDPTSGLQILTIIKEKFPETWQQLHDEYHIDEESQLTKLLEAQNRKDKEDGKDLEHTDTFLDSADDLYEDWILKKSDSWKSILNSAVHSPKLHSVINREIAAKSTIYNAELIESMTRGPYTSVQDQKVYVVNASALDVAQSFAVRGDNVVLLHVEGSALECSLDRDSKGIVTALKECGIRPQQGEPVYTPNVSFHSSSVSMLTTMPPKRNREDAKEQIRALLLIAKSRGHDVVVLESNFGRSRLCAQVIQESFPGAFRAVILAINDQDKARHTVERFAKCRVQGLQPHPAMVVSQASQVPSLAKSAAEYNELFKQHMRSPQRCMLSSNFIAAAIADSELINPNGTFNREAIFKQINRDSNGEFEWTIGGQQYRKTGVEEPDRDIASEMFSELRAQGLQEQDALRIMCLMHQGNFDSIRSRLYEILGSDLQGKPNRDMERQAIAGISFGQMTGKPSFEFDPKTKTLSIKYVMSLQQTWDPDRLSHALINCTLRVSCDSTGPTYGSGTLEYSLDGEFTPFEEPEVL